MQDLIHDYLKSKKLAWSEATIRSETHRLLAHPLWVGKDPSDLYEELSKTHKPSTIKTIFTRLGEVYQHGIETNQISGANPFKRFLRSHANLFKRTINREDIQVSFKDAFEAIAGARDCAAKEHALLLLKSGLRISESYSAGTHVKGKGAKVRKVFGACAHSTPKVSKTTLRRFLKGINLKPHTLRKLCATRLAEKGATPADLCEIMGWSSINTAYYYLQPMREARLEELMGGI